MTRCTTVHYCTLSLQRHVRLQLNQRSGHLFQCSVDVLRKRLLAFNIFTWGDGAEQQQQRKTHRDLHSCTGSLLLNCAICKSVWALYRSIQKKQQQKGRHKCWIVNLHCHTWCVNVSLWNKGVTNSPRITEHFPEKKNTLMIYDYIVKGYL